MCGAGGVEQTEVIKEQYHAIPVHHSKRHKKKQQITQATTYLSDES